MSPNFRFSFFIISIFILFLFSIGQQPISLATRGNARCPMESAKPATALPASRAFSDLLPFCKAQFLLRSLSKVHKISTVVQESHYAEGQPDFSASTMQLLSGNKGFSRALRFYRIMGGEPQGSTWIAWLNQSMNRETFRLVSKAFLWLYPIVRLQEHLAV